LCRADERLLGREHWSWVLSNRTRDLAKYRRCLDGRLRGVSVDLLMSSLPISFPSVRAKRRLSLRSIPSGEPFLRSLLNFSSLLGISPRYEFAVPLHTGFSLPMLVSGDPVVVDKPYVTFHVGSSRQEKCWPAEYFRDLAVWLGKKGYGVVVAGRGVADARAADVVEQAGRHVVSTLGSGSYVNLSNWVKLVRGASVVVGNDSGPTHLAAAVGVATIGLYGPTDNVLFAPPFSEDRTLRSRNHRMDRLYVSDVCDRLQPLLP